jgi:hypothetical protein
LHPHAAPRKAACGLVVVVALSPISDAPEATAAALFQGAMHGIGLSTGTRAARCARRWRELH